MLFSALPATAQPVLKLKMQGQGGNNGAGVAWNPDLKVYYAVFAGNPAFPLEVFTAQGKPLFQSEANFDVRGIWCNPKTKQIEGNGFGSIGWFRLLTNSSGEPLGGEYLLEGSYQPDDQSVGTFDPKSGRVLFFDSEGSAIQAYDSKGQIKKVTLLQVSPDISDELNYTTALFTGVKKKEIALFYPQTRTLYFFNGKNGKAAGNFQLPASAPNPSAFNLAYANGRVWLFDKNSRIWKGYQVKI